MNKVKFYFILSLTSIVLFSCNSDDNSSSTVAVREYSDQYAVDIDSIETYLKTHSFSVVDVAGRIDVEIDTFIVGNTTGKVSIWDNTDYPLQFKMVKNDARATNLVDGQIEDPVEYKLYYLLINEGGGASSTRFDSTYVSYRGWRLDNTQFDIDNTPFWATFPRISTSEISLISGFRHFTTLLKAPESVEVSGSGEVVYNNYGVGVVFIPSGLAYFNTSQNDVPVYSPLVFTVRLHGIRERDHDSDGVLSKYENGEGVEDLYTVDSDGDTIPDFLDIDDDNDGVRTILETRFTYTDENGKLVNDNYPFNGALVDDPTTPYDERKAIPDCAGDDTNPTRLRKHLDANCQ